MRYKVIASYRLPHVAGYADAEIVLCRLPDDEHMRWVTWQRNTDGGAPYWGQYHHTEIEARRDFIERCKGSRPMCEVRPEEGRVSLTANHL